MSERRPSQKNRPSSSQNSSEAQRQSATSSPGQGPSKTSGNHPRSRPHNKQGQRRQRRNPDQRNQGPNNRSRNSQGPRKNSYHNANREKGIHYTYRKLLDHQQMHDNARKKYFELFYRAQPEQQKSLERKFYETLNRLRQLEDQLTPQQKEQIAQLKSEKRLDTTYSTNHDLSQEQLPNSEIEGPFIDPHITEGQKQRSDFSEDTEESHGSMEDYYKLKGTAPLKATPPSKQ